MIKLKLPFINSSRKERNQEEKFQQQSDGDGD